jgi:hypothetical protein
MIVSSVIIYTSKIITFEYDKKHSIDSCWVQLKEYCRKLGSTDKTIKSTYPDTTLFIMFAYLLLDKFTRALDNFLSQENIDIDTKIRKLTEKKNILKSTTKKKTNTAWKSKKIISPKRYGRYSSSSFINETNCFLYSKRHFARDCPYVKKFRDFMKKSRSCSYDQNYIICSSSCYNKARERSGSNTSKSNKYIKFDKPKRSLSKLLKALLVQEKSNSEAYDSDSDRSENKYCYISKNELSKYYHSTSWAIDTGASSHIAY